MASGFGIFGGRGRCYPIWMDFSECMSKTDSPKECRDFREDYLECLHHRKEFIKLNELFREAKFQEDHGMTSAEAAKHGGGHGGGH